MIYRKEDCTEVKGKLNDRKRYLKTGYRVHYKPVTAACPELCRKFALSDEQDTDGKLLTPAF